jgi:polyhydroxybutyrate depolymerase
VLEIHGTADPCWPVDGGPISCADRGPGSKISVNDTLALWRANGGCGATSTDVELPDRAPNDGTRTLKHAYACGGAVEVQFYEVLDGGHTWPGSTVASNNGAISQDFSANEVILDFFTTH